MAFLTTSIFPNGCPIKTTTDPKSLYPIIYYPIGFSLKAAMAIAWRAYEYRMVGEVSDPPFVSDSVNSVQLSRTGSPVNYTREMSPLLCSKGENNLYNFDNIFGFLLSIITDDTEFGKVYEYNNLYYISLQAGYGSVASSSFRVIPFYSVVGSLRFHIDGEVFEGEIVGSDGTSCNIDIYIETERNPD